ncbi:hypothetical protein [Oceanobacillus indicireducens]|uniref:Uncharacterized protein n=1 Tax=Oceanobacillus indicireducens TaxID=1004261 RepID=A0A917Y1Z9_9BACI|nr:hypothetical protein [Oceanobacillus indicireducens]GGN64439.1 hypothetical protein GCM10007971_32320 [Oceanobacillus indicireducens]
MNDQLQTAKDWLGDLSKIVSRQKTKEDYEYAKSRTDALDWLIQQAERVEELKNRCTEIAAESTVREEKLLKENQWLEKRVEELEEMLEKEVTMSFVLEGQLNDASDLVKRYKQALEFYADDESWTLYDHHGRTQLGLDGGRKARQALKGESQ